MSEVWLPNKEQEKAIEEAECLPSIVEVLMRIEKQLNMIDGRLYELLDLAEGVKR